MRIKVKCIDKWNHNFEKVVDKPKKIVFTIYEGTGNIENRRIKNK